jgi:MFS family permease
LTFMPDQRLRGWGVKKEVVILSAARMADAFANSLLIVLLPLYIIQTPRSGIFAHLPDATLIGLLISLAGLVFALMQPVAAWVSDRSGRRKPFILAGLGVVGLATLGYIPADSYRILVALRMLQGFGISFTIPTALALIAAHADRDAMGGAMGIFTTARMIGYAVGPLVGGLLMELVSFQAAFVAGSAGALLSLLLVLFFVPEVRGDPVYRRVRTIPSDGGPLDDGGNPPTGRRPDPGPRAGPEPGHALRQISLLGAGVFSMALTISLISAVEPELNARLGQTAIGFGIVFAMLTFGRFLTQIPIGSLSDRIGRRRLILLGLALVVPLGVLQGFAPTTFLLALDRFLLGIATAMVVAPSYAMVADLGIPGLLVRQMSMMTMSFGLGVAIGPLISGTLAGVFGFEVPFLVGGGLCLAVFILQFIYLGETVIPGRAARVA